MQIARHVVIQPATRVRGSLRVPGDKSVSHRYALIAALAAGPTTIHNYAPGRDCQSTLACLTRLGVGVDAVPHEGSVVVRGRGLRCLVAPHQVLDCGNSGSTMRMLAGVVAAHAFETILSGDQSLTRRPMRRIAAPLTRMGATVATAENGGPPLRIQGAALHAIDFAPEVVSAQVKSAVLLAGLQAEGTTRVTEGVQTRDHTERALRAFGAVVDQRGPTISLAGGQTLRPTRLAVPGDLSSATFAMVAAASLPGSEVQIEGVGLNPTRTALLDVLRRFGVLLDVEQTSDEAGEPVGRLRVRAGGLGSLTLDGDVIPSIIDELPALAVLATAGGELRVTGAAELRVKESDRISALVGGLRALGADAEELPDGFHVRGGRRLTGGHVQAHDDHRLAMAFAVAALSASGPVTIDGADAAAVSYPAFFADLERLRA